MLYLYYPKCTTCGKASHWLAERGLAFTTQWLENPDSSFVARDIKKDNPTEAELRAWHAKSGLPLKRFFNTSGQQYRALELKDKLPTMSEDEQFALLASDGMLVKRPILVGDDFVLVGFKQAEWEDAL
ncbi:MAG: arsenate reductase family protein [Flavonifractor sp.]|nr:arsenate reductase family protein [Flavonifractor sp.]